VEPGQPPPPPNFPQPSRYNPTRFDSLGIPGDTSERIAVTAWLGLVGVFAFIGGSMIFHAMTGLDRKQERFAHHGARVSATLTRCHYTPGTRNRDRCTLRYVYDDRRFSVVYRNRGGQFRGLTARAGTVPLLLDQHHPSRVFTLHDVTERSKDWQSRTVIGLVLLVAGAFVLLAPLLVDYLPGD
jgi:hypothetical protein